MRRRARDHFAADSVRSKLPPPLCPSEPRRPPRVKQAVPYGNRSGSRPLSSSSCELSSHSNPRCPEIQYPIDSSFSRQKDSCTYQYASSERSSSSPSRGFACAWTSAARRGTRRIVSPCVHPGPHTHCEIRGRNAPGVFNAMLVLIFIPQ